MADASKFTPQFIGSSAAASHTSPDRLSTLPTEVLLMITSNLHPRVHFHLVPKTPARRSKRGKPRYSRVTRFCCHPHVLALSRTCKQLHAVLSPELFRALVRKEKHDLLEFAMKRGDVRLATRLLEGRHVAAAASEDWMRKLTREWQGVGHTWGVRHGEEMTREVVRVLAEVGAGRRFGRDWHELVGLPWPKRRYLESGGS